MVSVAFGAELRAGRLGKTTLTEEIAAGPRPAQSFALDDKATRYAARNDPPAFVPVLQGHVLIDEVQRAQTYWLRSKRPIILKGAKMSREDPNDRLASVLGVRR